MTRRHIGNAAPVGVFLAMLGLAVGMTRLGDPVRAPRRLPISLSAAGAGAAGGRAELARAAGDSRVGAPYHGGYGRYELTGTLPGDLPASGPAYELPAGQARVDAVRRLAGALGLSGEPRREADAWVVTGDGNRGLRVFDQPGNPWYYGLVEKPCLVARPATGPAGAPGSEPAAKPAPPADATAAARPADSPVPPPPGAEPAPPAPGTEPAPSPAPPADGVEPAPDAAPDGCGMASYPAVACPAGQPCPTPSQPPLPGEAETRSAALPVLQAAGYDADTARISYEAGWDSRTLLADPVVAGLRVVHWGARVSVLDGGSVRDASGWLGTPAGQGAYPLLAPGQAIDRTASGPQVMIARCDAVTPECTGEAPVRKVTAVAPGLMFLPSYDGRAAFLVPAWLLTVEGSPVPEPVLALPDEYLAPPPSDEPDRPTCDGGCPPPPSGEPGGKPGSEPGGGSSGEVPPDTGSGQTSVSPAEGGSTG